MDYRRIGHDQPEITQEEANMRLQKSPWERHKTTLRRLGIAEIVLGFLMAILTLATFVILAAKSLLHDYHYFFTFMSPGLWGGMFLILNGIFGVKTHNKPSTCIYTTNMVLSIISCVVMYFAALLSCFAGMNSDAWRDENKVLISVHFLVAAIAFLAFITSIVHSACCCCANCVCCNHSYYESIARFSMQVTMQLPNDQFVTTTSPNAPGTGNESQSIPHEVSQADAVQNSVAPVSTKHHDASQLPLLLHEENAQKT